MYKTSFIYPCNCSFCNLFTSMAALSSLPISFLLIHIKFTSSSTVLEVQTVHAHFVHDSKGVGSTLAQVSANTTMECMHQCMLQDGCDSSTYNPHTKVCDLLDVTQKDDRVADGSGNNFICCRCLNTPMPGKLSTLFFKYFLLEQKLNRATLTLMKIDYSFNTVNLLQFSYSFPPLLLLLYYTFTMALLQFYYSFTTVFLQYYM